MVKNVLYSEIRDELETGDLVAWDTTEIEDFFDFILFIYSKVFRVKYTHVGVVVKFGSRIFVLEAIPPVVRLVPLSAKRDFYLIKTKAPVLFRENGINYLFKFIGRKYSILDFVRTMLKLKSSDEDFYCSELAAKYYKSIGYILDEKIGHSPQNLVEHLVEISSIKEIRVTIDSANITN